MSLGVRGLLTLLPVTITVCFLWATEIPLGIPGEWTWPRLGYAQQSLFVMAPGLLMLFVVGLMYLWISVRGLDRSRERYVPHLALLFGLGLAWSILLQWSGPQVPSDLKPLLVTQDRGASGYFEEARRIRDFPAFLAGYNQWIEDGETAQRVLHQGTHPPGLIMVHRGMQGLMATYPSLQSIVLVTLPNSIYEAFRSIIPEYGRTTAQSLLAALWAVFLTTQVAAMLPMVLLFIVLRQIASQRTAWIAAAIWPLVPAIHVFVPKSDVLFPLITMLAVCGLVQGRRGRTCSGGILMGLSAWFGMVLSLAFAAVLCLLISVVLIMKIRTSQSGKHGISIGWTDCTIAAETYVLATLLFGWMTGIHLIETWRLNWMNHEGFYDQFQRTYRLWLPVNLVELGFAIGLPLFAGVICWGMSVRSNVARSESVPTALSLGWILTWLLLWVSGKNMGEAARLWIFLMPLMSLTVAVWLGREQTQRFSNRDILLVLSAQMLCCAVTVLRVSGFEFLQWTQ